MSVALDRDFAGSIPEIYDRHLVPLIFEAPAVDLAGRIAALRPNRVLETAAGSGVLARALAPLLDPEAGYHATDLSVAMLARARARMGGGREVAFEPADAQALPYPDGSFDVVACQFGVMFFPELDAALREARRVLRPGGAFLFSVWDRIEANGFAALVHEVAVSSFAEDPPDFLSRLPHGFYEVDLLAGHLEAAGFDEVETAVFEAESRASSPREPAIAYLQGTPLRSEIEVRDRRALPEITAMAGAGIAERFGAGPVSAPIRAHILAASA